MSLVVASEVVAMARVASETAAAARERVAVGVEASARVVAEMAVRVA